MYIYSCFIVKSFLLYSDLYIYIVENHFIISINAVASRATAFLFGSVHLK